MRELTLERFCFANFGTYGSLDIEGIRIYTVERPWLNNKPSISCIPNGTYICKPRMFFRGGYPAVEIIEVPNRTHILIHKANLPTDVEGCVGLGVRLGAIRDMWACLESKEAFGLFMDWVNNEPFTLHIIPRILQFDNDNK